VYLDAGIIIPALNESASIGKVIEELIKEGFAPSDICVVDNGSTDDTVAKASSWNVQVLSCPFKGKGNAVYVGMTYFCLKTDVKYIFTIDGDFTYPAAAVRTGYQWLSKKLGNVYVMQRIPEVGAMPWLNELANFIINKWTGLVNPCLGHVPDVCSGLWCFPRKAVLDLLPDLNSTGFTIEAEYYCKLNNLNYQLESFPFEYRKRFGGEKKTKPIDAYRIIKYMWDNR
jgi:glycosyltransferase involved in cell wall biosynthesis